MEIMSVANFRTCKNRQNIFTATHVHTANEQRHNAHKAPQNVGPRALTDTQRHMVARTYQKSKEPNAVVDSNTDCLQTKVPSTELDLSSKLQQPNDNNDNDDADNDDDDDDDDDDGIDDDDNDIDDDADNDNDRNDWNNDDSVHVSVSL